MRVFGLTLVCLLAVVVAAKKRYDGYKVLTLQPATSAHIDVIKQLSHNVQLDFWSETDVMVPPGQYGTVVGLIEAAGLRYSVKQENVQESLDASEVLIQKRRSAKNYDLNSWNTYEQIVAAVDDLAASCPAGWDCSVDLVGQSHEGRDVPALWIRSGNKKTMYLDSLLHCREWLAGSTVLLIADRLINGNDAEAVRMRTEYNWYIAPILNPDGYVYTWDDDRLWRKNREPNEGSSCVGTDLNRNFDANWMWSGTDSNPCSEIYGGPSAASSIEIQNVQNKLQELRTADGGIHGVISYHAYANMWLHAYGYATSPGGPVCATPIDFADINSVAFVARNAVQSTGGQSWKYGSVCNTIYPASGSMLDYSYDKVGAIYAYTPECRGDRFDVPTAEIEPSYREQWAGMVATADTIWTTVQ